MDYDKELNNIFKKWIGIDFLKNENMCKVNFFDPDINLRARDLVVIFLDVIETFSIDSMQLDLNRERFDTFEHALILVKKQVENNYKEKDQRCDVK